MSAQAAVPETLGHLSEPPQNDDPNSKRAKAITGKSPLRIAMAAWPGTRSPSSAS